MDVICFPLNNRINNNKNKKNNNNYNNNNNDNNNNDNDNNNDSNGDNVYENLVSTSCQTSLHNFPIVNNACWVDESGNKIHREDCDSRQVRLAVLVWRVGVVSVLFSRGAVVPVESMSLKTKYTAMNAIAD